jgi:bacteriorhodopsin
VYVFGILTFGIYFFYFWISTKNDMNKLGAKIPTGFLLIIPIANLYWIYKYTEALGKHVKKDNNGIMYFIVFLLLPIIIPAIAQNGINNLIENKESIEMETKGIETLES